MNQTLKISIARGACRFATPLYLGGKYDITFSGERSDEAKTILFTKCKSKNPNETDGIEALAVSATSEEGNVSMNLNKQVLVDFFKKSGECDVDGSVDVHAYIFDENGVVLADSDVSIEFKPLDFVIDADDINRYGILLARIVAVEDRATDLETKDVVHEATLAQLAKVDEDNKVELTAEIVRRAEEVLSDAKTWASKLAVMVARMSYIRCANHSTDEKDLYHKVDVIINEHGECVLRVDQTPVQFDGSAEDDQVKFLYSDEAQDIVADKVFKGCKLTISNDGAKIGSFYVASGTDFDVNTQAKFLNGLAVTGDVSVAGNVTVSSSGHFTGNIHNSGASVVTAVRNVADGDDANNAASTHWVRTRIANWWTAMLGNIRGIFVDFTSDQTISGRKTFTYDIGRLYIKTTSESRDDDSRAASVYPTISFRDKDEKDTAYFRACFSSSGAIQTIMSAIRKVGDAVKTVSIYLSMGRNGVSTLVCNTDRVHSDAIAGAGFPDADNIVSLTVPPSDGNLKIDGETIFPKDGYVSAYATTNNLYTGILRLVVKDSAGTTVLVQNGASSGIGSMIGASVPVPAGCSVVIAYATVGTVTAKFIHLKGRS